ncbi:hypothetical protein F2Q69_00031337 [Brassica cretica]|uniref:Uncharacterized protein n=1 Tax=Brassica cretica TaxID=69181 RepID=A0A8S9SAZ2_BRACR|nr:hypothetical protein F2Q69_00031337 [Brassica cretica]
MSKVVECHRRKLLMAPLTLTLALRSKVVECHRRKLLMAPLTLTLALRRLVRKMTAEGVAFQGS